MKKKKAVRIGLVLLTAGIVSVFFFMKPGNGGRESYRFSPVSRGDVAVTVSSTGTLAAQDTVEVGTEVSGTVKEIFVDYNDPVKKGQVLARLKTDLLESSLHDAEANLSKARAQAEEARINYSKNKTLYEKGYLSEKEFLPFRTANETAGAVLQSAQAAVDRATTNLEYAVIRSPIDGIILERAIEAGQTVAASFSTPKMFIIAKDLSKMRIKALVDETDISKIKTGQKVTFTVSAYPDKVFYGAVSQIRRQPVNVSNVVNYTVMVDASNEQNLLFPGMTTTIEFTVDRAEDVFLVPNEALEFRPPIKRKRPRERGAAAGRQKPDSGGAVPGMTPPASTRSAAAAGPGGVSGRGTLWTLDEINGLKLVRVKTGLSDETNTAVYGDLLSDGMPVITGYAAGTKKKKSAASSRMRTPRFF